MAIISATNLDEIHEKAKAELRRCIANDDYEIAHINADDVLVEFLRALGYSDVADLWDEVGKWYS